MTTKNVEPSERSTEQVSRQFRQMIKGGAKLVVDGQAKSQPLGLLGRGYTPKYAVDLFGTRYFLCNRRNTDGLKVLPAYVMPPRASDTGAAKIYARVFYKDSSLVWRSASHYVNTDDEHWIGKGAVRWLDKRGERGWYSAEETTNLPFEIQEALDTVSQRGPRRQTDRQVLSLILRNAPSNRVSPYRDFQAPRDRAMAIASQQINSNKSIAWFEDENDPASLKFVSGYEPDFKTVIDVSTSRSTMYGSPIHKYRIASSNRRVQYLFVHGPKHVWIVNPQALSTEISSYGLRTVDAVVDEDLVIPGYEFVDNEGSGEVDDQIPPGFAGDVCPVDPDRADASPWNEAMPVIQAFRRAIVLP